MQAYRLAAGCVQGHTLRITNLSTVAFRIKTFVPNKRAAKAVTIAFEPHGGTPSQNPDLSGTLKSDVRLYAHHGSQPVYSDVLMLAPNALSRTSSRLRSGS